MDNAQPSLLSRDDTFFGVCQGLGEDFGFNPNWLRAALAILLFWNPVGALAAYAGAGLVVAFSRWLVPNARPDTVGLQAGPGQTVPADEPVSDNGSVRADPLAVAA